MENTHTELTAHSRVYEDILEDRQAGCCLDELVEKYAYLSRTEINNVIADIEQ